MKKYILLTLALAASVTLSAARVTAFTGVRTDALDSSAWNESVWISAADAPVVEGKIEKGNRASAPGASWFVLTLDNARKVKSVKWMASGLGVFQLFLNGTPVGEEVLRPGFTHAGKTKYSFTYDVSSAVKKAAGAQNVFAAQVTPGWWGDKIVTPGGNDGMIGRKCAFRAVLEIVYADGGKQLLGTSPELWKAGIAGPVKHAGIFDGEYYDAREPQGWLLADKLGTPEVNTEFEGEIFPSAGAEVYLRRDLAISPVKAYVWSGREGEKEGEFGKIVTRREFAPGEEMTVAPGDTLVVDFGQNAAAVPEFVFKAAEGTVLTCLPSEILNDGNGAESRGMDGPEGSVHRTNLREHSWAFRSVYTFASAPDYVTYTPSCTFFGYRFVSITATSEVRIKSLRSIPVTSIAKGLETGTLTTGNDLINKLISNTVWGQRSNYLSVPTDCPQRDERLGWTADTQVFAETGTFFANTDSFFHKWMRDMRDSQSSKGSYPGVAPTAQYGGNMMRLGWADAGVIVPWTVWKQFGDVSIIDENWDSMAWFVGYVNDTKYDHLTHKDENRNYQWADWLSYEYLESNSGLSHYRNALGRNVPRPEAIVYWNYLSACYWAMDAAMMADMAAATGRDAGVYAKMEADAKAYIMENFLGEDGVFFEEVLNFMQTPALFALKLRLLEGEAKDAVCKRLRANFAKHGDCLQTGFLGTSILMQTLTENGMADVAYTLLFQRKNPSWLYSVDNGATTIWERWNSYTYESGMGPKGMNSFNHYAYGCVCQWIWETAAGIAADSAAPGFRHIVMSPVPDRRLGSLSASFNSAAGLVKSSWKYEGSQWIWDFTVPKGATATVTLPDGSAPADYPAGKYHIALTLE